MYWWIVFIIAQIAIISAISVITLREFISFRRTAWYATFFSCVGWALCFSIVLMIPVDIIDHDIDNKCEGIVDCEHPVTYLPPKLLEIEWNVLYWGTFFLSWFIFPFMQSYWLAGDFTKFDRFFTSFKENIYIYVIMGILGGGGIAIIATKDGLTSGDVRQLAVLLANIYGLVVVVLLLGYGLVDIPRYLFRKADRRGWLKHYMIQTAVYKREMEITKQKLDDTVHKIRVVSQKIGQENQLRPFVDTILQKCPAEYSTNSSLRGFSADIDKEKVKYNYLVDLHQKVMNHDHAYTRASRLYEQIVSKALNLEDVLHSRQSIEKRVEWHFKPARTGSFANFKNFFEWLWQVYLYTWAFRLIGLLCALLSLVLVWCEVVMPNKESDLSPLSLVISPHTKDHLSGIPKQLYCVVILTYMAVCTYTSLFKLQIWDYYRLVPHQQSDANSIMFSANYLCRLAAPLSFNFLSLTRQIDSAPAFSKVMGPMDGFFKLGSHFMYGFPCFVALFCLCTLFNVWARIARSDFMKNLFTNCWPIKKLKIHIDDPQNLAEEGATILRRERETREENNTGVSFDSVGDFSDCFVGSSDFIVTRGYSKRFGKDANSDPSKRREIPKPTATTLPPNLSKYAERPSPLKDSKTLLRDEVNDKNSNNSNSNSNNKGFMGRPNFSFGDRKNRYTALRSDIP